MDNCHTDVVQLFTTMVYASKLAVYNCVHTAAYTCSIIQTGCGVHNLYTCLFATVLCSAAHLMLDLKPQCNAVNGERVLLNGEERTLTNNEYKLPTIQDY